MRAIQSASVLGTIFVFCLLSLPTCAQEQSATQISAHVPSAQTIIVPPRVQPLPPPPQASVGPRVVRRQPLGKSFWISWAALGGLTIASTELTMACAHRPGCAEGNPLWGKKPRRSEMYGIRGGLVIAGFFLSRSFKHDGDSFWKFMPATLIPLMGAETVWDAHMLAASRPHGVHSALVANVPASQVEVVSMTPQKSKLDEVVANH